MTEACATRQLEVRVALACLDGVRENDVRRLVGMRLAMGAEDAPDDLADVDVTLRACLRQRCTTHALWRAFERGIATGRLLVDVYRDGFVEGYRDALGEGPLPLAAE